jgi:DivIVA domain-containing protein
MKSKTIKRYISDFPDLKLECEKLADEGYEPYGCTFEVSFKDNTSSVMMKVLLENLNGEKICITQNKKVREIEEFVPIEKNIMKDYPKVKLSKTEIHNKEFKNRFIGYNCYEVDSFLDLIAEDYDQMSNGINTPEQNEEEYTSGIGNRSNPKLKLSEFDILNKEFKKSINGYDSEEVDNYLDLIFEDYKQLRRQ